DSHPGGDETFPTRRSSDLGVRRRAVDEDTVGRPRAAGHELAREVEVAYREELHAPPAARVVEARRHVPRPEAERRVLGPRPRVVAEVDAPQQHQVGEPRGLTADLDRKSTPLNSSHVSI